MYISIEQALNIYDELLDAKNGINGYGGTVAEIYVFRVMPYSPFYSMHHEGKTFDEDNRMIEKKAAEDFHTLCYIFAKKHEVSIFVNDLELNTWINQVRSGESVFSHRVHVEVKKLSQEKNV